MGRLLLFATALLTCACGRLGFEGRAIDDVDMIDGSVTDAAPAQIAWVKTFTAHITGTPTDTFSAQATIGNAIVMQVACSTSDATPTAVTVTAPGWTFTPLDPVFESPAQFVWAATFGAIVPSSSPVDVTVTWTTANCNSGLAVMADEFTNVDPTGGNVTFDAHTQAVGSGICSATVTTGNAYDAIWASCLSLMALAPGPGYTLAADDGAGDLAEYKVTTAPAGTLETAIMTVNGGTNLMSAITIKPRSR